MSIPPFQRVLDRHGDDVHRFLVATVGSWDADDCYQETCIAALRAYPRLENASNLRAWLLRIAERKAIDAHRARGRRPVPVDHVPDAGTVDPPQDGESRLWAAVRELPMKQRTAVFCRSVLGMPYEELAGVLDSSQDAARRNVHEGLKTLRQGWDR